jgi:hypothetical protein
MKLPFFFCFFAVSLADFFVLLKYIFMGFENISYKEDYPMVVTLEIVVKGLL